MYALWYVFDRLWMVTGMISATTFGGTWWLPTIYSVLGAKIGKKTFLEDAFVHLPFMLTVKDHTVVETGVKLETIRILRNGDVQVGRIVLESNVVVGAASYIGSDTRVGSRSILKPLSRLPSGNKIGKNSILEGHRLGKRFDDLDEASLETNILGKSVIGFICHLVAFLIVLVPSLFSLVFNTCILLGLVHGFGMKGIAILVGCIPLTTAIASIVLAMVIIYPLRFILLGGKRASPMQTKVYSIDFHRYWTAIKLYSATIANSENTILSRYICKLLGANIDIHAPFALEPQEPHLTSTGRNLFCANGVKFRNIAFSPGGYVGFDKVDIGDNCMIFDRSVVEAGARIDNNVMVGSVTVIPRDIDNTQGTTLMGNPLMRLRLMADGNMDDDISSSMMNEIWFFVISTYWLVVLSFLVITAYLMTAYFFWIVHLYSSLSFAFGAVALIFPFLITLVCGLLLFISFGVKAICIGNFNTFLGKGEVADMNSGKLLRWEIANFLISSSCHIPLLVINEFWVTRAFWKLMGAKIGINTMIDPNVLMLEADMLDIGDECRVEEMVTLLCHKFNRGNLEMEPISIPNNTIIRSHAVILPGSKISGKRVKIMPLTHVLPGENLTDGVWHGSPAECIDKKHGIV